MGESKRTKTQPLILSESAAADESKDPYTAAPFLPAVALFDYCALGHERTQLYASSVSSALVFVTAPPAAP